MISMPSEITPKMLGMTSDESPGETLDGADRRKPAPYDAHALEVQQIAALLDTDLDRGLTEDERRRRLDDDGPNSLPEPEREGRFHRLTRELTTPMSLLLLAAGFVSWPLLGDVADALIILVIVIINASIGSIQEGRAADALTALRSLESATARALCDGTVRRVPTSELVRGDVVVLRGGDRVPADLRLIQTTELEVDESILTGESLTVGKSVSPVSATTLPADRHNMAFSGTHVVKGVAKGVVAACGAGTEMGLIATGVQQRPPPTPLQVELSWVT